MKEYLGVLDDAAFGAASEVEPKFTSHSDPASQWTAARKGPAFFSYSTNYLIDTDHSIIVDVDAHGLTVAATCKGGASLTFWWDYDGNFQGFEIAPAVGVSAEVEYVRGTTRLER